MVLHPARLPAAWQLAARGAARFLLTLVVLVTVCTATALAILGLEQILGR